MNAHVFIAQSLDGYIADKSGSIEFLKLAELISQDLTTEDYGYAEFMEKTDCIVMGRKTWNTIREFDFWPFANKHVIVLSKHSHLPIANETFFSGTIEDLWQDLKSRNNSNLYVDGAKVIQSFLAKNLISTMTITTLPILLGGGIRLFGDLAVPVHCRLEKTTSYPNGITKSLYAIVSKA